jgi:hypothetical protein
MRLILHIGYYKTGSTALQNQLEFHAGELARSAGLLYPKSARPARGQRNHSAVALQAVYDAGHNLPPWYSRTQRFQQYAAGTARPAADALVAEIQASKADTVIVSSEEFTRFVACVEPSVPQRLIEQLAPESTTVVCYVRRPDLYLDAWYNQLIKIGARVRRLSDMVGRFYKTVHVNFDWVVSYWRDVIGDGELIVRNYDQLVGGNIVSDFADAVKVHIPETAPARDNANARIDNNFIEYVRRLMWMHDGAFPSGLRQLLDRVANDPQLPARGRVSVLDAPARESLYAHSVEMNERLGRAVGLDRGFFVDIDEVRRVPGGAISDVEAYELWKSHLDVAIVNAVSARPTAS